MHASNSETVSETRAKVLQRSLAWQVPHWDLQQDCHSKDNQKADNASQIHQQLLDCVHTGPWKAPAPALPTPTLTTPVTMPAAGKAPTSQKDATTTSAAEEGKRQSAAQSSDQQPKQNRTVEPTSQMATSPTHQKRPALPAPPPTSHTQKREREMTQ